jgi:hypothetical protein
MSEQYTLRQYATQARKFLDMGPRNEPLIAKRGSEGSGAMPEGSRRARRASQYSA